MEKLGWRTAETSWRNKTDSGKTAGNYFEYTFTGTGVEVYSQKHANFASFDIFIDNENMGKYSLEGSGSGDNQQLVFLKQILPMMSIRLSVRQLSVTENIRLTWTT